jgi:hypothetical protein
MKVTVFYDLRRSYRLEALIVRRHRPPGAGASTGGSGYEAVILAASLPRASRGLRLVPVASCRRRIQLIGQ